MKRIGTVLFLLSLISVLPSGLLAKGKNEVVVVSWGGLMEKCSREAYFKPFEKETGIRVIYASPPNAAKVKAMVDSGKVEWDVVFAAASIHNQLLKKGLIEKIDYKYFDQATMDGLYPEAKLSHGVGNLSYSTVMVYRTDVFSEANHPRNWAEFWDVKRFPGLRTLFDLSVAGMNSWEIALLADGVPMDQLYQNPDLDRAFKKLKEIKPHVVKWWKQGSEPGQLLVDKEVVLGTCYSTRVERLREQGAPVNVEWNQGQFDISYMQIPKGAPNYENALKFMAFVSRADLQADFAQCLNCGPMNRAAFEMIPPEKARFLPSYPANKEKQFLINGEWYYENAEKVIERWNKWILEK